jgi:hypothetical protein
MKSMLIAVVTGLAIGMPLLVTAAPDEAQKQFIQRAQEAKKKLAAAQAAAGAERQKMMQEHMTMMRDMTTQMQKAKPGDGMSPPQMREWIDEHLKLMQEMMGQMMDEHHMMMQGGGMPGMGKK